MSTTTMTVKGQITIPANLRKKFGLKPGNKVIVEERNGVVCLHPAITDVEAAFGLLTASHSVSLDDMDEAIKQGAKE